MKIRQNLHIHSCHSCDSACATLNDIQKEMTALGMTEFGLSDHLHTQYNLCDIQGARNDFLCYDRPKNFHFGIEISGLSEWERDKIAAGDYVRYYDDPVYGLRFAQGPSDSPVCIGITEKDVKDLGIEYVIAGVHWPLYSSPEEAYYDFFRQQLYLIENPLVDILAHPWEGLPFWSGYFIVTKDYADYHYDAFSKIPQEYWDEMAHLLITNNKLAELNRCDICNKKGDGIIARSILEKLAEWRDKGVKFTFGSDLHRAEYPLDGEANISVKHIAEALNYRGMDRNYV